MFFYIQYTHAEYMHVFILYLKVKTPPGVWFIRGQRGIMNQKYKTKLTFTKKKKKLKKNYFSKGKLDLLVDVAFQMCVLSS